MEAQRGRHVAEEAADRLVGMARQLIDQLEDGSLATGPIPLAAGSVGRRPGPQASLAAQARGLAGAVANGSRVVVAENPPPLADGLDWHSSYFVKRSGDLVAVRPSMSPDDAIRGWIPNGLLLDNPEPGNFPNPPGSDFGLRFRTPPVALGSVTGAQEFGSAEFAYNICGGAQGPADCWMAECQNRGNACQYKKVRGLHNGLDLIVSNGTFVYWTGGANAYVVDEHARDAKPNIVIRVGDYDVLFGHLSEKFVGRDDFIYNGTPIGRTGAGHLHLGVRTTTQFLNPLYFFELGLANKLIGKMGGYTSGEDAWSMMAYNYSAGECLNWYWGCNPDRTGIDRP